MDVLCLLLNQLSQNFSILRKSKVEFSPHFSVPKKAQVSDPKFSEFQTPCFVLCCGFLETLMYRPLKEHQLSPEICWLPICMKITGQKRFLDWDVATESQIVLLKISCCRPLISRLQAGFVVVIHHHFLMFCYFYNYFCSLATCQTLVNQFGMDCGVKFWFIIIRMKQILLTVHLKSVS